MKKKIALYGVLIALALMVSFVETLIPIPIMIPGIKLGLANSVILFVLYYIGNKDAFLISILRVIISGFLFANMASIFYSLGGALLSLFVMCLLKKTHKFSIIGISIAGAIAHNMGQLLVAAYVTSVRTVIFYFPNLMIAGIITGALIGIIGKEVIRRIPKNIMFKQ